MRKISRWAAMAALLVSSMAITYQDTHAQKLTDEMDTAAYMRVHRGQYITLQAGGGIHGIHTGAHTAYRPGASLKIGYRLYPTRHLGIGTGILIQHTVSDHRINATDTIQAVQDMGLDEMGRPYMPCIRISDYGERVTADLIQIPAAIYWQANITDRIKAGAGAGAIYTMAGRASGRQYAGLVTSAPIYQDWNLLFDGEGHGTQTADNLSSKYTIRQWISAMAEAEIMYSLNPRMDISISSYATYALGNATHGGRPLYNPYETTGSRCNGALEHVSSTKTRHISAGLMAGLRIRMGHQARMELDYYQQTQLRRKVVDYDMKSVHQVRLNDDEKKSKRFGQIEDDVDSTLLAQDEYQRRKLKDYDIELPKQEKQSTQPSQPEDEYTQDDELDLMKEIEKLLASLDKTKYGFNQSESQMGGNISAIVDLLASIMKDHPDISIMVIGHTCDIGTEAQNKIVGLRRAEAFKHELVKRGVPPRQIECSTKWYTEPIAPNTSPENRAKNRRVQLLKK